MPRTFVVLVLGLAWATILPAAPAVSAKAMADSFSVHEPISIELMFTGVGGIDGYLITVDPPGKNPPLGLYMSGENEAGFGSPVVRGANPTRPFRHMVLLNKWVTLDRPGRYTVTIDTLVGAKSLIKSVVITVVERDEARLQQACTLWGERANGRALEIENSREGEGWFHGKHSPQRYARQVLMYLQDESLIPCLLQSASKMNRAPAIAFREMDSVAAVRALQQLMRSPVVELAADARNRLGQLRERTRKDDVRKAAAEALDAPLP